MSWIGHVLSGGRQSPVLATVPLHLRLSLGATRDFAAARAADYLGKANAIYVSKLPAAAGPARANLFYAYARLMALAALYDGFAADPYMPAEALSEQVVARLVEELAADEGDYSVSGLLRALARSRVLLSAAPALFDGGLSAGLEARARQRATERARLSDLVSRDSEVLEEIALSRAEIADHHAELEALRRMAGEETRIAELVWQIEAAQERIFRLKRQLLVPIAPAWQDTLRVGG